MAPFAGSLKVMAALTLLGVAASPPTAVAKKRTRPAPRADLVVSKGSVRSTSGSLGGSFVLKNRGNAGAGKFTASITVRVSKRKNSAVKRFSVPGLGKGSSLTVKVATKVPSGLPAGSLAMQVCADSAGDVRERSESNNCLDLGKLKVASPGVTPNPNPTPTPDPTPTPTPVDSHPTDPFAFTKETVITRSTSQSAYFMKVPSSYDATHDTPTTLFLWMHGCGGDAQGDLDTITPGADRSYIAVSLGGRDGGCWDPAGDQAKVLAAVADVKTHFNVNPRRVILGGYSSGGDLGYRTIFYNANLFAGILAENTAPFRDTGSSSSQSIGAAAWKFNVVHLLHTEDDTYDKETVRSELQTLTDAGFPVTKLERPGTHYDDSTATTGTDHDLQTLLLRHIDDGWLSPG